MSKCSKSVRVLVMSDLHCGHRCGLTPPQWQTKPDDSVPQKAKWASIQQTVWNWYTRKIAEIGPVDITIVNGDMIDGKGARSEGCEQITSDRSEQADMAFQAIAAVRSREYRLVRGTPYHVGPGEDFENSVADKLDCKIGDHEWYDVRGVVFDVKHHVPGYSMPHTKSTGLLGDVLWNMIWSDSGGQPMADIYIRSHLHAYNDVLGVRPDQRAFVTPAMQGIGTRFGARQCRRIVNVGFIVFDVKGKGDWTWRTHLMSMESQAAVAEKL